MSTLTMRNLQKRYENGYEAVPGLDLEINDGEFLVLVGPSGCGKSTTGGALLGLLGPSASVRVRRRPCSAMCSACCWRR